MAPVRLIGISTQLGAFRAKTAKAISIESERKISNPAPMPSLIFCATIAAGWSSASA
jgi:hypothetical protein